MESNTLTKLRKEIIKKKIKNKLNEIELYLIEKIENEDNLYNFSFKITSDNSNPKTIILEIDKECSICYNEEVNLEKMNLISNVKQEKKTDGLYEIIGDKNNTLNYPYFNKDICYYNDYKKIV